MPTRRRRTALVVSAALAGALTLGVILARPRLESDVARRLEASAARHGLRAQVGAVHLGVWPLLRLDDLRLERPARGIIDVEGLDLLPGLGVWRLRLSETTVQGPGGLAVVLGPSAWTLTRLDTGLQAEIQAPAKGLRVLLDRTREGPRWRLEAQAFPAHGWAVLRRAESPLLDPGTLNGTADLAAGKGTIAFEADVRGRDVRTASLSDEPSVLEPAFGQPAGVHLRVRGEWREPGTLRLDPAHIDVDGTELRIIGEVREVGAEPEIDLAVRVDRADFARILAASGLSVLGSAPAEGALGSASLDARFQGRLTDPASFTVSQELDFVPPAPLPTPLTRLRGDFQHTVALEGGAGRTVEVSPQSTDFIGIGDVPPRFVRMLLIAEDAGFFGHRGIDLTAMPEALLTNWARGRAARGGSTITQQLAKNLFLSRDKNLGRKLQELCLALLLEAALDKNRILEVYLNVIEWGPGLYGLRPAARRYFGKEPADLSATESAFLVCLIPGPKKYQASIAGGAVRPGFRRLIDDLLTKLRSVDVLSEEEYQAALAEPLAPGAVEGGEVP